MILFSAARLEEALQAVRLAWEVYRTAGYEHYRDYFEKRIHDLEAAIAVPASVQGRNPVRDTG